MQQGMTTFSWRKINLYERGESTANINDHKDFDNNVILAGAPRVWHQHLDYNQFPLSANFEKR